VVDGTIRIGDEPCAIVRVRRWLRRLRAASPGGRPASRSPSDSAPPTSRSPVSMDDYNGLRPLRHWLAERLLAESPGNGAFAVPRTLRLTAREFGITLPAPSLAGSL
jgi:hypothetical protein